MQMSEMRFQFPSQEDPLEKGMAAHSITLAWRLPRTEETAVGFSPQGCQESDTTGVTEHTALPTIRNHLITYLCCHVIVFGFYIKVYGRQPRLHLWVQQRIRTIII